MRLISTMPTVRAGQLMATAAKHFAHKVAVETTDDSARVAFPTGQGVMTVTDRGLALQIDAADAAAAETVREVFEGHLLRFAHREAPAPLVWTEG